jgi:hypothetical protein
VTHEQVAVAIGFGGTGWTRRTEHRRSARHDDSPLVTAETAREWAIVRTRLVELAAVADGVTARPDRCRARQAVTMAVGPATADLLVAAAHAVAADGTARHTVVVVPAAADGQ